MGLRDSKCSACCINYLHYNYFQITFNKWRKLSELHDDASAAPKTKCIVQVIGAKHRLWCSINDAEFDEINKMVISSTLYDYVKQTQLSMLT